MFNYINDLNRSQDRMNDAAIALRICEDARETLQTAQQQRQQLDRLHMSPEVYYRR